MITHLEDDFIQSVIKNFGPDLKSLNLSNNGLQSIKRIEEIARGSKVLIISQNDISDINPLSELVALEEIDLSDNSIHDVAALSKLSNLESIDLRGNRISSIADLLPLAGCNHLRRLSVSGNPLCHDPSYPAFIFKSLPQITSVDEWTRQRPKEQSIASDLKDDIGCRDVAVKFDDDSHRLIQNDHRLLSDDKSISNLLKSQLDALEQAFTIQEKALATSVPSSSSLLVKLSPDFSYVKLLQLWRRQAVRNIYERQMAEAATSAAVAHAHRERTNMSKQIVDSEATAIIWKEKCTAHSGKVKSLEQQLNQLNEELSGETTKREQLEIELQSKQSTLTTVDSLMKHVQNMMNSQCQNSHMVVVRCSEALRDLEARLVIANDRVRLATELVAQKEVQLRNSVAAMEAEKRLSSSHKLQTDKEVSENSTALVTIDTTSTLTNNTRPPLLSDLKIRPEIEGFLKSVFRQLDENDSGRVPLQLLAECFLMNYDCEDDANQLQQVMRSVLGDRLWIGLTSSLRDRMNKSESEQASSSSIQTDLTWGEFLLLLLPASPSHDVQSLRPLDHEDMVALRDAGVWGDGEWGAIPLTIPSDFQASVVGVADNLTRDSAVTEVCRLHRERAYLLSKLQQFTRELDHRAEGIKAAFEGEISSRKIKESHLLADVTELRGKLLLNNDSILELESRHRQQISQLELRLLTAEEDRERLKQEGIRRTEELNVRTAKILAEEQERYSRLENELNMLQRESSRKEVLNKGLQRDVQRLQNNLASSEELIIQTRVQTEELQRQLCVAFENALIQSQSIVTYTRRVEDLEGQNTALLTQVEDLRSQVAEMKLQAANTTSNATAVVSTEVQTDDSSCLDVATIDNVLFDASSERGSAEFLLREEMEFLRSLPSSQHRLRTATSRVETLPYSSAVGSTETRDVYAAHLNKLLQLAEAAINRSS